jgi:hypothetical protein
MEEEHDRMVDELEEDADRIQEPSRHLEDDIKDQRDDWDQKTKTEAVPGAMELPDPDDEEQPNRFEYEERTPETAEAAGPDAASSEDDDPDSDDSGS